MLKVFYDGACHLCFREVNHYKKRDVNAQIDIVDISQASFDAANYGLENKAVNLHMHAIDESGQVFKGIDCFVEIWRRVPSFQRLIPFFENKYLRPILDFGYDVFARHIRPRLPKRNCEEGVCT